MIKSIIKIKSTNGIAMKIVGKILGEPKQDLLFSMKKIPYSKNENIITLI
ncbi:hypothetical protein FLACOL_02141 [Flavobacterium columnare]|uniref:Uncharacterized protein n=1 Tax=Flavobacterium columnare TaxID=996 RepID=A0A2N9PCN3_9FLAO|nr:hypothetical protein [Flavobacterium columnare]SPE78126.1 hypothetical protein FLACOL_02141 [Flavobacterium columnare]